MGWKPTALAELARQARGGDADAALTLARRVDERLTFCEFVAYVVPGGELSPELFDRLADGFDRARSERAITDLNDTIEGVSA